MKGRSVPLCATKLCQDQSEFNVLFVHSEIDDYGLSKEEFRIYAHLARRAGQGSAWPSIESIAAKCIIHPDTVYAVLRRLKELNLIRVQPRPGFTSVYTLTPRSQWKPPRTQGAPETEGYPSISGIPPGKRRGRRVPEKKGYEGNPVEGNPLKDNTV
jgi:hypothetical protein